MEDYERDYLMDLIRKRGTHPLVAEDDGDVAPDYYQGRIDEYASQNAIDSTQIDALIDQAHFALNQVARFARVSFYRKGVLVLSEVVNVSPGCSYASAHRPEAFDAVRIDGL